MPRSCCGCYSSAETRTVRRSQPGEGEPRTPGTCSDPGFLEVGLDSCETSRCCGLGAASSARSNGKSGGPRVRGLFRQLCLWVSLRRRRCSGRRVPLCFVISFNLSPEGVSLLASEVPFNSKIWCWVPTLFIFLKMLFHTSSKFYFLGGECPRAS